MPIADVDLETPEQSIDEVEWKTTESIQMTNVDEQRTKTIEFSPIGKEKEISGNTGNNKRRVKNEEDILHGEIRKYGRDETER